MVEICVFFFTKSAQQTYVDLDAKLFEAYIEEKTNPIVGGIEQNMYSGNFDWNDCHSLTGKETYSRNKSSQNLD